MLQRPLYALAPAKINIHLHVGKKRNDGFHEIASIFQTISLADRLLVRFADIFSVECLNVSLPKENSLKKAYEVFCRETGFTKGVEVRLLKEIPACAGLGGASSDAVALLKVLNSLAGTRLTPNELSAMAGQVGSDCPFFVKGGTAFVSGRGDIIESIEPNALQGLVIMPTVLSETPAAYALLDKLREGPAVQGRLLSKEELTAVYNKPLSEWSGNKTCFCNDFESVIFSRLPEVAAVKEALLDAGAQFALMSGSGTAVFGLFHDAKKMREALYALSKRFSFCKPFLFCSF